MIVEREINNNYFKDSLLVPLKVFAKQLLINELHMVVEVYLQAAAKFFVQVITALRARQETLSWDVPPYLRPTKSYRAE